MTAAHEPIERRDYVTAALMGEYRPAWHDPNKRIVFEIACPPGAAHGGRLAYSRWTAMPLPENEGRHATRSEAGPAGAKDGADASAAGLALVCPPT